MKTGVTNFITEQSVVEPFRDKLSGASRTHCCTGIQDPAHQPTQISMASKQTAAVEAVVCRLEAERRKQKDAEGDRYTNG